MIGQRLPDGYEPTSDWHAKLGVGSMRDLVGGYGKDSTGTWCVITPNGRYGSLAKHQVVEHEDGTITVSPSILVYPVEAPDRSAEERAAMQQQYGWTDEQTAAALNGRPGWHGFLERGVWREC